MAAVPPGRSAGMSSTVISATRLAPATYQGNLGVPALTAVPQAVQKRAPARSSALQVLQAAPLAGAPQAGQKAPAVSVWQTVHFIVP